jgi:hypothetical protein
VRGKGLAIALLSLLTVPALAEPKPLDCTQLLAWLTGGVSSSRLSRLAQQHGIAFAADAEAMKALQAAGAETTFIQTLRTLRPSPARNDPTSCPAALAKAAELAHQKH